MPKIIPVDSTRVLAVVSHLRFPALVALDRWGLVPLRGYGHRLRDPVAVHSWDARTWGRRSERADRLLARIRRSIVRYRPALIVLGVPAYESLFSRTLRDRLAAMLTVLSIPYVIRRIESAWRIVIGQPLKRTVRVLAEKLASVFPRLDPEHSMRRNHRLRWYVLALALVELARRYPRQSMALLPCEVPGLCRFIRAHELRLHPKV